VSQKTTLTTGVSIILLVAIVTAVGVAAERFGTKTVIPPTEGVPETTGQSSVEVEIPPLTGPPTNAATPAERKSVLVHLAPGADRRPVRQIAATHGGQVKYEYKILPNVINLRGLPAAAVEALAQVPGVTRVEEDQTVYAHMNTSAPLIRGLQSQITGAGLSADGQGVRICIVDTGIDSDNFMYADRIDTAAGRDFVNDDNDPEDDYGHGSHVAGIVAGGGWNVNGCSGGPEPGQGIAPAATLIGVKVMAADGSGSATDIIAGIDYCADSSPAGANADIINMSLGGGAIVGACDTDSMAAAANNAVDAGVVVVASSGNAGITDGMGSPACGSKVIAVGATYDDDYPNCEYSSPSFTFCIMPFAGTCWLECTDTNPVVDQIGCYSNQGDQLDVVAPGCITYSADMDNSVNGLAGYCGTSMAAPHVAGLAALILSVDPALTPAQVRQLIRDGALDMGASGFDWVYGYGRIDVINSLSLIEPGSPDPCGNGICELGEDCNTCPSDCESGGGSSVECGDGVCQPGEDCLTCPADCHGKQVGRLDKQYCCGLDGDCSDPRCNKDPWACSEDLSEPYCCGDSICSGAEDPCICAVDCGEPAASEFICDDTADNDCDGTVDCDDMDCTEDPACVSPPPPDCANPGEWCGSGDECCSGKCVGKPGDGTCK